MAGGLDKGLSSSMWSPAMTGRSPYSSFRRSGLRTSTTAAYPSSPAAASTYLSSSSGPNTPSNRTIDSASTPATRTTAATTPSPTRRCVDGPSDDDGAVDLLTAALDRIPTPWAELGRFTKIARRLKWKLPFLAHGYNAATAACVDGRGHDNEAGAAASMARAQRDEAELMFKLDFFEYYMLLERALVHLMGVFGIRITGGFGHGSSSKGGGSGSNGGGGGAGGGGGSGAREALVKNTSDHRFHANVLEALDDVRNPLHESLGRDDVRYSLARAKERESIHYILAAIPSRRHRHPPPPPQHSPTKVRPLLHISAHTDFFIFFSICVSP